MAAAGVLERDPEEADVLARARERVEASGRVWAGPVQVQQRWRRGWVVAVYGSEDLRNLDRLTIVEVRRGGESRILD
jgi:hypothetical protein